MAGIDHGTARLDALATIEAYHEVTKHHVRRYARSLGWLDWPNQPDPFRRYMGAPLRPLPLPSVRASADPTWDAVRADRVPGPPAPVAEASLGDFFGHSLALSAWKQARGPDGLVVSRWPLRVNPSSGNLHPTEGWLIDADGVHHYAAAAHALELRGSWGDGPGARFDASALGLPAGSFLVAVSSIPWREAWKYGERAFRYCQHDAGHALAALGLAAARLGWTARRLEGVGTAELAALLGLDTGDGPEFEHAEALLAVVPGPWPGGRLRARPPVPSRWLGQANRLSREHHDWPLVAAAAAAVAEPAGLDWEAPAACAGARARGGLGTCAGASGGPRALAAGPLIRGRRSAVAMDGGTTLGLPAFCRLLAALLPAAGDPALRATGPDVDVALILLVHRVDGLAPGLYALCRAPDHEPDLRAALRADFAWERPDGVPATLPLYRLGTGDLRETARQVSCGQAIAADGVFSAGLLARFAPVLAQRGPGAWARLFQETGAVGQLLYLEAEAAGLRGTGIGCFFDDEVHRALGLVDRRWQSLYHFTVGGPVDDPRLQSEPAYAERSEGTA
ncbi:MAG: nitroreductase family protein [bacterium]|nr:nitroreductase family protein [bacterium]